MNLIRETKGEHPTMSELDFLRLMNDNLLTGDVVLGDDLVEKSSTLVSVAALVSDRVAELEELDGERVTAAYEEVAAGLSDNGDT